MSQDEFRVVPGWAPPRAAFYILEAIGSTAVAGFEFYGAGEPGWLRPEERAYVESAVPRRVREFAAGRQCARLALRELGGPDEAIPVGLSRQPKWPPGIVGSITHTVGYCLAVVAVRGTR